MKIAEAEGRVSFGCASQPGLAPSLHTDPRGARGVLASGRAGEPAPSGKRAGAYTYQETVNKAKTG